VPVEMPRILSWVAVDNANAVAKVVTPAKMGHVSVGLWDTIARILSSITLSFLGVQKGVMVLFPFLFQKEPWKSNTILVQLYQLDKKMTIGEITKRKSSQEKKMR